MTYNPVVQLLVGVQDDLAKTEEILAHMAAIAADPEPITHELEVMLMSGISDHIVSMAESMRTMAILISNMADKIIEMQEK